MTYELKLASKFILKRAFIKIIYKPLKKISQFLSSDKCNLVQGSLQAWKLHCECDLFYIDQTKRAIVYQPFVSSITSNIILTHAKEHIVNIKVESPKKSTVCENSLKSPNHCNKFE